MGEREKGRRETLQLVGIGGGGLISPLVGGIYSRACPIKVSALIKFAW